VAGFEHWFAKQKKDIAAANAAAIVQRKHFEGATP
jgi:hypothetical protein